MGNSESAEQDQRLKKLGNDLLEIQCGKAPKRLRVIFTDNNENMGRALYIQRISENTQLGAVAKFAMGFLGVAALEVSFVGEYSKSVKLFVNRKIVVGDGQKISIDALTGFLTSGITCRVDSCIKLNCIRIRFADKKQYFGIPLIPDDQVQEMKRMISEKADTPVEMQLLRYGDNVFMNDETIGHYGIEEGDVILLETQTRFLQIVMENGVRVRMIVKNEERIIDVCKRACDEAKISSDQVQLLYKYKSINQNKLIGELDLENDGSLTVKKSLIFINVRRQSDKIVRIKAKKDDTIERVKLEIHGKEGIDPSKQYLFLGKILLENEKTLVDYDINDEETLDLYDILPTTFSRIGSQRQMQQMIQIYLRISKLKKVSDLSVKNSSTIQRLKIEIQDKEGIRINQQRLLYEGTQLEEDKQLIDYNIQSGS
ncbi:MAG: putative Ubiquitin B, partial [Streblomastix strix]